MRGWCEIVPYFIIYKNYLIGLITDNRYAHLLYKYELSLLFVKLINLLLGFETPDCSGTAV